MSNELGKERRTGLAAGTSAVCPFNLSFLVARYSPLVEELSTCIFC
jgi:hypothetical protein